MINIGLTGFKMACFYMITQQVIEYLKGKVPFKVIITVYEKF